MRRVDALDIESRIGLGITEFLSLLEHVSEVRALVAHLRQNKVAGAVDDAGHPFDAVARQPFPHGLDDGNAASHRGLEGYHDALFLRLCEDFIAVHGNQGLVGRDHVFAIIDRGQHQLARRFAATD